MKWWAEFNVNENYKLNDLHVNMFDNHNWAYFCHLISNFGYQKCFKQGMLGWTNIYVVYIEYTYS